MAHDVFISYSSHDKPIADAICAGLEAAKIRCWIAPRDMLPGVPYAEALGDALRESQLLLLVLSSNSNHSSQVMREVECAVDKGIPILPFRVEDVEPSASLDYFVKAIHWLDAITPPLEMHLDSLTETVRVLLTRQRTSPVRPGPPGAAGTAGTPATRAPDLAGIELPRKRGKFASRYVVISGLGVLLALVVLLALAKWRPGSPFTEKTPSPGASGSSVVPVECLRGLTLVLESAIRWEAISQDWRTRRAGWIKDVSEANSVPDVAALIRELEVHGLWSGVTPGWKDRRDAWIRDCSQAKSISTLATLLAELESYMSWDAVAPAWKELRTSWLNMVVQCTTL